MAAVGDTLFQGWLRQTGKQLFTRRGPATTPLTYRPGSTREGAEGGRHQVGRSDRRGAGQALGQSAIATGKAGLGLFNRQATARYFRGVRQTLPILLPTIGGNAKDRKAWYKASMLWSASSDENGGRAGGDQLPGELHAGLIQLAERGIPRTPTSGSSRPS